MTSLPPNSRSPLTDVVDARVREIVASAGRAALDLQREVEEASIARGLELRRSAEQEAERIRVAAQAEADAYLEECRRRAEVFAAGRVTRLQELSDDLLAQGEAIRGRLRDTEDLHRSLEELVTSLTVAARAASSEAARPAMDLPRLVAVADPDEETAAATAPLEADPDVVPELAADRPAARMPVRIAARAGDPASPSAEVRDIARGLPRLPRQPPGPIPPPEDAPSARR